MKKKFMKSVESALFEWESIPVELPPALSECFKIEINELFVIPNEDELDEVANDSSGNPKLLNTDQLKSIQKYGYILKSFQKN
jgi:hypothetical protein